MEHDICCQFGKMMARFLNACQSWCKLFLLWNVVIWKATDVIPFEQDDLQPYCIDGTGNRLSNSCSFEKIQVFLQARMDRRDTSGFVSGGGVYSFRDS